MKNKKGFTLIEILIVISIIGLLASVVLVNLGGFRAKGRDSRRIADLRTLQNTLELYFGVNNKYPSAITELISPELGVSRLPQDPGTNLDYSYCYKNDAGGNPTSYIVGAKLEGKNVALDSDEDDTTGYTCGATTDCSDAANVWGYCIKF